jgi:hypothetical protein
MEGERIPKRVLNGKFHNRRSVGKPRQDGRTPSRGMHYIF